LVLFKGFIDSNLLSVAVTAVEFWRTKTNIDESKNNNFIIKGLYAGISYER
jgi:hypothetical protein